MDRTNVVFMSVGDDVTLQQQQQHLHDIHRLLILTQPPDYSPSHSFTSYRLTKLYCTVCST